MKSVKEYRLLRGWRQRGKRKAGVYNKYQAAALAPPGGPAMATDVREKDKMGRVLTEITVENLTDLYDAERGLIPTSQIRRVTIPDAVVDTGATFLSIPSRFIQQLGLKKVYTKRVTTSNGPADSDVYNAVWFTMQGRSCTLDVMEVPDSVPALIGQLPLEHLDFVVDPVGQKVIGNPAHGGEQMYDLL
jgi:predicted aspartyl protease